MCNEYPHISSSLKSDPKLHFIEGRYLKFLPDKNSRTCGLAITLNESSR